MKHTTNPRLLALLLLALAPTGLVSCATSGSSAQRDSSADVVLPPYHGPKARIILDEFEWGAGHGEHEGSSTGVIETTYEDEQGIQRRSTTTISAGGSTNRVSSGLHASLRQSLMSTNRFIVGDRKGVDNLRKERDLRNEGLANPETGARIGQVQGADLLIRGTVLEWEEDAGGSRGGGGGILPGLLGGGILDRSKGKVVVHIEIVDLATLDTIDACQVVGEASATSFDLGLAGWTGGALLGGVFSEYEKKPMGDAIRKAIAEAVKFVGTNVPQDYFRHTPARAGMGADGMAAARPATRD